VPGCLDALAGRYRLGMIANQQSAVRAAIRRDGIEPYFAVWAISEDLGFDKPDPRLFRHALDAATADPERTAMCGDRLDYDVPCRPPRRHRVPALTRRGRCTPVRSTWPGQFAEWSGRWFGGWSSEGWAASAT
jgi:FMN phosphatase YigB (HAD superfamily)